MDVTLLLNQSGAKGDKNVSRESTPASVTGAASTVPSTALPTPSPERASPQRESERLNRGRTPWNAGGYSLPLHSESKAASNSAGAYRWSSEQPEPETAWCASVSASIHSRHGSSDSDMASARDLDLQGRPQLTRTMTLEHRQRPSECIERRLPSWHERRGTDERWNMPWHKMSDSHSSLSSYGSWQSRCHSRMSSVTTVSGGHHMASSLAELPILESKLAEHHGGSETDRPMSARSRTRLSTTDEAAEMEGPRSPSDAVLNMKAPPRYRAQADKSGHPYFRASRLLSSSSSPRIHKRAISAPDFAPPSHSLRQGYAVLPRPQQAMAISANGPRNGRGASAAAPSAVAEDGHGMTASCSSPAGAAAAEEECSASSGGEMEDPRCMFVVNCDTGSQLRKAISHLFGRNKSCTLKIPRPVWVYYCRKHYQRIRYRNAKTYPANQMELVKVQIRRLQTWSDNNKNKGRGPFIKQWTLSLRKREQNRLESGKGGADAAYEDQYAAQGGCAVPDWIIHLLGDGYSTERMLDIAERLHKEIVEGVLTQVPEIEFLPDIVDDDASKPARARRHNSSNTPKRKASDLPALTRQDSEPLYPDHQPPDFDGKRARLASHELAPVPYGRPVQTYMVPPRAPKVVPQMHYAQPDYEAPRFGSHFQHSFNTGAFYANANSMPAARYPTAHEAQLTLPPLGMQIAAHAPSMPKQPRFAGHMRSLHQRSASAFTPGSRPLPASTRPSSSGNTHQPRLDVGGGYQVTSHPHNLPAMGDVQWKQQQQQQQQQQQHAEQAPQYPQAWAHDYGHGFAPQHAAFQHAPVYSQPHHRPERTASSYSIN
ncbi:hypothetical protein CDD81_5268 [Ophiocordyceps australis]|uniref:ORP1 like protein n=1 Tax=Ophiocordyceps australis TaxID=1399860 RepID=A0A2C5YGT1_9HYPO|nr:hypothetical protein CDD81_5268 [Ophiocordyceps australis]